MSTYLDEDCSGIVPPDSDNASLRSKDTSPWQALLLLGALVDP